MNVKNNIDVLWAPISNSNIAPLDLPLTPYVVYGVKYIDLVSL